MSPTSIFAPASTHADAIVGIAALVIAVTSVIFLCVGALLIYAVVRYRRRRDDDGTEPAQVYGSNQVEIAWIVVPMLIVVVLFLTSALVIPLIQDAHSPADALEVVAVGHQYWWEYRYPSLGIVTANELHVPVSDRTAGVPTFLTLLSSDTDHSFWIPRLGGKTDLIPNRLNRTWIDPYTTGLYLGQCAQYCGTQHAKMLLRVYVDPRDVFDRWVRQQQEPARQASQVTEGQRVFQSTACVNCHAVSGTAASGQFGPDLTHLMSRDTIGAGIVPNTVENLRAWIQNPESLKPGSRMPAMQLTDRELDAVTAYLASLR